MADRRRQVILLIGSRFDQIYLPPGALRTDAGFVPQTIERCPTCNGTRTVRDKFNRPTRCTRCNGRGRLAYDAMDAQHAPVGSAATTATARPRATVRCDACNGDGAHGNGNRCHICNGVGRRELHAFELAVDTHDNDDLNDMLDKFERARKARDEAGSYHELDQALAGIAHHVNKPRRFEPLTRHAPLVLRLLDEVFLPPATRDYPDLNEWEQELVDRALEYITGRMPDPIRVPADVVQNAKELREHRKRVHGRAASNGAIAKRDDEIRKLIRRGTPTQRVAFDYGLSVSQVNRIVAGQTEDAA